MCEIERGMEMERVVRGREGDTVQPHCCEGRACDCGFGSDGVSQADSLRHHVFVLRGLRASMPC